MAILQCSNNRTYVYAYWYARDTRKEIHMYYREVSIYMMTDVGGVWWYMYIHVHGGGRGRGRQGKLVWSRLVSKRV